MIDRKQCKLEAKRQLTGRWGQPVGMFLIIILCGCVLQIINAIISSTTIVNGPIGGSFSSVISIQITAIITFILSTIIVIMKYSSLYGYIEYTKTNEKIQFSTFFKGFNKFGRSLGMIMWRLLWMIIWTSLFIIPGFVKYYSYSQAYYICAENKEITPLEALKLSKIITKENKYDLFCIDFSFTGWILLSILSFGIGFLWIVPYITMTKTNIYHSLLKEALEKNLIPADMKSRLEITEDAKTAANKKTSDSNKTTDSAEYTDTTEHTDSTSSTASDNPTDNSTTVNFTTSFTEDTNNTENI